MAYRHPRTPEDRGAVSLYLLRWSRSAALLLPVVLTIGATVHGQTLAFRDPRELLRTEPATFIALLESARPSPLAGEDMAAILRALPTHGEVTALAAAARQKVDAVRQLLTATRREWYAIKVIDLPHAGTALHARAVVLIPTPTIALLSGEELQAMVAHEIGHEYVWTEWHRAREHADRERLKQLELLCDAIGAVTLQQLGMDPSRMIEAIEKVTRFNQQRFGLPLNDGSYPSLAERRAFAGEIQRWLSPL